MGVSKMLGMKIIILLSVYSLLQPQLKQIHVCYKIMCGCECYIYDKSMNSSLLYWRDSYLKNSNIKSKMFKEEDMVKNHITYMKHIKIQ